MTNDFDAFSGEAIEIQNFDMQFGEIVIHKGYKGIRVAGERGYPEYDPTDPQHQAAITSGKKVYVVYEIQHYPNNAKFDTFPQQWPIWSDDWKLFEESMGILYGLNPKTPKERDALYKQIQQLTNGGHYFQYETPILREYDKKDGTGKGKIRGIKVLKSFPSADECAAAETAYKATTGLPDDSTMPASEPVATIPEAQALAFVPALANQVAQNGKVDPLLLAQKFAEFPMLAGLDATSEAVKKAVEAAGLQIAEIAF